MTGFFDFVRDFISPIIAGALAIATGFAIAIPMFAYAERVQVEETSARVVAVGAAKSETYQCGSNKVGDVSIPIYCTRVVYPTTFSVSNTDETFSSDLSGVAAVGTDYTAYKVIDGDSYSYSLSSPKDMGFTILTYFLAIFGGLVVGVIAFAICTSIFD